MKHKRQHYIPASYLRAWCDPETPSNYTPYVWRFSKDGNQVKKKAPKKIFYETDLYTVRGEDGERDLTIEYNLSRLESEFSSLRESKLDKHLPLSPREYLMLSMFTAAMYGRTIAHGEHTREQWQKALDLGERIQEQFESATPEERERMSSALESPHAGDENSLTMDEVRDIVENPLTSSLSAIVTGVSPLLFRKPYLVLVTKDDVGFITSDAPCVWFDPAAYETPRPFGAGGLISPTLEITLPLSPNQMLFVGSKLYGRNLYLPVDGLSVGGESIIDNLNRRTRVYAHEYFVANRGKAKPEWF